MVNSFSKTWSMTGWRLGWITAPAALGPAFEMLTEYNIAGPPGFVQRAGVVAVRDGEPFVEEIVARYRAARDLVLERVAAIPRVSLPRPEAAFYAFIRVDGMGDSVAFAKDLLMQTGVGLAPAPPSATTSTRSTTTCACASPRRSRPSSARSTAWQATSRRQNPRSRSPRGTAVVPVTWR